MSAIFVVGGLVLLAVGLDMVLALSVLRLDESKERKGGEG